MFKTCDIRYNKKIIINVRIIATYYDTDNCLSVCDKKYSFFPLPCQQKGFNVGNVRCLTF